MTHQNDEYGEYFPLRVLQNTVKGTLEHHTAQVIGYADAVCWIGMLRQLKKSIWNLRKQPQKLGSVLLLAKLKLNHV